MYYTLAKLIHSVRTLATEKKMVEKILIDRFPIYMSAS